MLPFTWGVKAEKQKQKLTVPKYEPHSLLKHSYSHTSQHSLLGNCGQIIPCFTDICFSGDWYNSQP